MHSLRGFFPQPRARHSRARQGFHLTEGVFVRLKPNSSLKGKTPFYATSELAKR
jgi:hypothetical protein